MRRRKQQRATPHILVDVQTLKILHQDKITRCEKLLRNREARKVGEIFLQWVPLFFFAYNSLLSGQLVVSNNRCLFIIVYASI